MRRKTIGPELPTAANQALVEKLRLGVRDQGESGQPLIYETELGRERLRATVVWDEWDGMPMDERTAVILRAYELGEGKAYRDQIALASGLTVPEAYAAGMLPYQVSTALRKGDPVNFDQCWDAMDAEGASKLFGPNILQLRFATREEAEACRQRLIDRLPGSGDVWVINREISVQHTLSLRDSIAVDDEK